MKRSNRLILLIGIFLAVVAFVAIALLLSSGGGGTTGQPNASGGVPTTAQIVVARANIPLGVVVTTDMVDNATVPVASKLPTALTDENQIIGRPVRRSIGTGAQLTSEDVTGNAGQCGDIQVPGGQRAMAIQVDQISGVGTVVKPGDFVDAVVGFTGDRFQVVQIAQATQNQPGQITVVPGINTTTVKLLLQGMQALCTLLPPPAPAQNGQPAPTASNGTALNPSATQIVILSVTPQQSEVLKFAQMEGNITLTLRDSREFQVDPTTGQVVAPVPDSTTGIILRSLVRDYGVLVPELVEAILPTQ